MLQTWHFVAAIAFTGLCAFQSEGLQNRDAEFCNSSTTYPTFPHGVILLYLPPPRNFTLGVAITVALNIQGSLSNRLVSVISQELLNPKIDGLDAYYKILSENTWVNVTPDLRNLINKTTLDIEDLKTLVNVYSCRLVYDSIPAKEVYDLVRRLSYLFWKRSCIKLDYGCSILYRPISNESTTPDGSSPAPFNNTERRSRSGHQSRRQHQAHGQKRDFDGGPYDKH